MRYYKIKIESLDNKPITERTQKTSCIAETPFLPEESRSSLFYYIDDSSKTKGVKIQINGLEQMNKEYRFVDSSRRPFKITLLD
jgi:hypothetical protein